MKHLLVLILTSLFLLSSANADLIRKEKKDDLLNHEKYNEFADLFNKVLEQKNTLRTGTAVGPHMNTGL